MLLESMADVRVQYGPALHVAEWALTLAFTVEYVLRLVAVDRPWRYAVSFYGIVDLLAILPTYVALVMPVAQPFMVVRGIRLLRIFRVLKAAQFLREAEILVTALRASRRKITVFLGGILTVALVMGALMYVVEGEAIALRADGRPRPFQETMRRLGRRLDVEAARQAVPLSSFFFDLLHLGGEGSLIALPYAERAQRLKRLVAPEVLLPSVVTREPAAVERFFDQAVAAGHEGLMAKSLAAPYAAGQRGFHWLKLKPHHTLDLVILAVERGSGRRTRWLSNLHLGARDEASGRFVMLGKTFKGLTDEMLEWQTRELSKLQVASDGYVVHVRPELVAEIAFSDVQASPRYPAGLALRLARVRRYRPEKPASEADTLQAVREIFERQRA